MRLRFPLASASLAALVCALPAAGQPLSVERRGPETVPAEPGSTVTIAFHLANSGPQPFEARLRASASAELRPLLPRERREIAAGGAELVLLAVRVGSAAPAGRHAVRLSAEGGGGDSVWVDVAARRGIAAVAAAGPALVVAGESYTARFRVRNTGNAPERVTLDVRADGGARPTGPSGAVLLAPGEEVVVAYRVETAGLGPVNLRHQVALRVAAEDAAPGVAAAARSVVEVLPLGGRPGRGAPAFPVEARLRSDGSGTPGYELSGSSEIGDVRLAFRARSADAARSPFARQDDYFVSLATRRLELQGGDGIYRFSRLGAPARYLTGARGAAAIGPLAAGAYAAGDRRGERRVTQRGTFLRLGVPRAGAGLLQEWSEGADGGPRRSLEGWVRPGPLLRARAEVALHGGARHLQANGASSHLWYDATHVRARPEADRRLDHDALSISLRPASWLAALVAHRRGLPLVLSDTALPVSMPRVASRARLDLFRRAHLEARAGRQGSGAYAHAFRSLRAGVSLRGSHAALEPAVERGERRPEDGGDAVPYHAGELRATVRGGRGSLSATVRREEGALLAAHAGGRWSGDVHGSGRLSPGLELHVGASAVRTDSGAPFALGDLRLERALGGGHVVTLRGTAVRGGGMDRPPALVAEYRLPLGVPVPFAAPAARDALTVRVMDASTGRPVAGAVVRVAGRTALTGRRGVAVLDELPAGTHPLRVERTDAAAPWITRSGEAVEVRVGERSARRVEVEVAAAGTVAGLVLRTPATGGAGAEPLARVEVVLRSTTRELRAVTGADGTFRFEGVWPGWWRVSVEAASLPRHHEPGETGLPVLVRPGTEASPELRVVERVRPVRMIGAGEAVLP